MSQKSKIKEYLEEHGSISFMEAERYPISCHRLSARIYELQHDGMRIIAKAFVHKRKDGSVMQYKRYYTLPAYIKEYGREEVLLVEVEA